MHTEETLSTMSLSELAELYNNTLHAIITSEIQDEVSFTFVKKFSDKKSAVRRTLAVTTFAEEHNCTFEQAMAKETPKKRYVRKNTGMYAWVRSQFPEVGSTGNKDELISAADALGFQGKVISVCLSKLRTMKPAIYVTYDRKTKTFTREA